MEKKIKDIGEFSEPVLIFGGVYSNLEALTELRKTAESENISPENIICTGDIVGYCADAEKCVTFVREWGVHSIIGNVEEQLRNREKHCGCNFDANGRCNLFSNIWYPYAQKQLSEESINWMKKLPDFITFRLRHKKFVTLHGSGRNISEFIFQSTPWNKKIKNFSLFKVDAIIAGHSGVPFISSNKDKYWINSGVIGMPANDGTTKVWYGILKPTTDKIKIQLLPLKVDFNRTIEKMNKENLPSEYAKTLATGLWDNCEILPKEETENQGKHLHFSPSYLQF